ncbi:MAG: hypothetical protein JXA97_05330 [Anaerolineales bacterium]|nr:hypothetical protein [Anaerolineales bacterium]
MRSRRHLWIVILIATVALAARLIPGPRIIDDAYITFRYARNLLGGYGFVYNPGEWVLGTTTPLYALLLSGFGFFFGGIQAPFPEIAWFLNACCDAIACALLFLLGNRVQRPGAGLSAALLWAIAPMSVTFAIGGMETSLFILLMLASFYFYSLDQTSLLAVSSALSILTRPDALLFVLPVYFERIRRALPTRRSSRSPLRIKRKEIFLLGLPLAAWGVIAWDLYGSPVPHSIAAKVAAYQLPAEAALVRLLQHYATPFLAHITFGNGWIAVGLILFPTLFFIAVRRALRADFALWPIFFFPIGYFLAYAVANPLIFRWYLAPPLPILFLGIFLGVAEIGRDLRFRPLLPIFFAAALSLTLNGWKLHPDHGPDRPAPDMAYIKLELLYQEAASVLIPLLEPGDLLAAGDIGALGYDTDAVMLDTLGLISPQSVGYYPLPDSDYVINVAMPSDLLLEEQPMFLVALEVYGRRTFLQDESFLNMYDCIQNLPSDIYGSDGMLIFERSHPSP